MRWLWVALALALDLALLLQPGPGARGTVYPLAPPLTRLDAMGARTLAASPGPEADPAALLRALDRVLAQGPPGRRAGEARARLDRARATVPRIGALHAQGLELRAAVQQDAVALARVLGPKAVERALAEREALAAAWGEGRAWAEAVDAVRQRAGPP